MDLIKVGEKLLSSVRSFNLLSPTSDRPEVPARAAAAAAVARALAGVPPHQRLALSSNSSGLASLYGSGPRGQTVERLEEQFYEEDFDPVGYVLENIPIDENDLSHFDKKVSQRLVQLDVVTEQLSHKVMEHYEELVKGMEVVTEVEQDLQVANVICKNGRRHLSSSMNEVSRDLIVTSNAKRKQFFLDMLPVLTQLQHCLDLRSSLDSHVEEGNYSKAFQILAEYLQLLDHYTELSAVQEMNRGIEAWLTRTLEKLDTLLLGVCQKFNPENYIMVADAYALIDDIPGFAEKLQNVFTQIVLMETQMVLKDFVFQGLDSRTIEKKSRLTYNDLCFQLPETKFRLCLLKTLEVLFDVMCSYYSMMTWLFPEKERGGESLQTTVANKEKESMVIGEGSPHHILAERHRRNGSFGNLPGALRVRHNRNSSAPLMESHLGHFGVCTNSDSGSKLPYEAHEASSDGQFLSEENHKSVVQIAERGTDNQYQVTEVPSSESQALANGKVDNNSATYMNSDVWDDLRREAVCFVGQALDRGRKTFWQLVTSRISTLFASDAIFSVSTHQFLQCYEFVNIFILAGEAFCGTEATEFRQKMRSLCEKYFWTFHRQNIEALLVVLEKENWQQISPDTIKTVNLAGLVGDGAPLLISYHHGSSKISGLDSDQNSQIDESKKLHAGFSQWFKRGNPFGNKKCSTVRDEDSNLHEVSMHDKQRAGSISNGTLVTEVPEKMGSQNGVNIERGEEEDESEDLLADFIDEDSQLPSRTSNVALARIPSSRNWIHEEIEGLPGSSVSLLRSMDKYARLMQKLETISLEFFKGICQLFELYFYVIFKTFGQRDGSGSNRGSMESLNSRLRSTLGKITQGLQEQRIKIHAGPVSPASPISFNNSFFQMDAALSSPIHTSNVIAPSNLYRLKESCIAAESITRIGQILRRSRTHLQSMLPQSALASLEDFYSHMVESVSDLKEHIYRATARLLLNISGYVERISNVKWELKELGMEHNGYVDLLLGEFKYYKTRLAHGGISKEVQEIFLEYGVEIIVETLVEGLSRVKRCTNEGRALMSLDLQVLINGLQHLAPGKIKSNMQIVEAYIKAYYLPETEYIHWARAHPEYSKGQVIGLINLVASMNNWKRKTRVELVEKIETGDFLL
ncbi:uncharacterized protein LOC131046440 isoform X1 [Cryptomeria japonica]|uniref:uncharacterized protein LOC131046440 isoform X1 n=3 Tax=Cryptomeria japonica TaxID=3369 RepID=UPI0027DA2560|nr:uncharacterized protein LOC131046440 isoform X1 [Cryptomeria japonica]XP_057836168.2 uncharacterized protein LOC131046440 isoform X1 [Cryptomeria japonica]